MTQNDLNKLSQIIILQKKQIKQDISSEKIVSNASSNMDSSEKLAYSK